MTSIPMASANINSSKVHPESLAAIRGHSTESGAIRGSGEEKHIDEQADTEESQNSNNRYEHGPPGTEFLTRLPERRHTRKSSWLGRRILIKFFRTVDFRGLGRVKIQVSYRVQKQRPEAAADGDPGDINWLFVSRVPGNVDDQAEEDIVLAV